MAPGWVIRSEIMAQRYPQARPGKLGQNRVMTDPNAASSPAPSAGTAVNGDISIDYATLGDSDAPPILMIMGLGAQRVSWPPEFLARLADRGRFVITLDNRDAGLSTHLHDAAVALDELVGALMGGGQLAEVPYTLSDMADDAVAVLDAVGIDRAHIVGASMGGMIAQMLVIDHPERALSLTSVFSTTGEMDVGVPTDEAVMALISPVPEDREGYITTMMERWKVWSAPEHWDDRAVRGRLEREYDRSFDPGATPRQLAAILTSGSREELLPGIKVPTLVIHGLLDTLVQPTGGRRTAELIPGAELLEIPDMGHELPEAHWDTVIGAIVGHTAAGQDSA